MNDFPALTPRRRWLGLSLLALGGSTLVLKKGSERRAYLQEKQAHARAAAAAEAQRLAELATQEKTAESQRLFQASVNRLSAQARAVLQQAAAADAQRVVACHQQLRQELDAIHQQAAARIPAIAREMGGLAFLGRSVLLLAKDQFTGGSEAQQWITQPLKPLTQAWLAMQAKTSAAMEGLRQDLNRQSNEASQALLVAVAQVHRDLHQRDASLGQHLQGLLLPISKTLQSQQWQLGFVSTFLAADLVAAYSPTKRLLIWLSQRLQPFVQRAARTLAADAVLAAGDGPLPIGDLIAALLTVGFTGYTLWELYQTSERAPREMQRELSSLLQQHHQMLMQEALQQSQRLREQVQAARQTAFAPCLLTQN